MNKLTSRMWMWVLLADALMQQEVGGGSLCVDGGALVNGSHIAADTVVIASNATLAGSGYIQGALVVGGALSPGISGIGTQDVSGSIGFLPGSTYRCSIASHDTLDQISAGGPITGACAVVLDASGAFYPIHRVIARGHPSSSYAQFTPQDAWFWRLESTGSLNLAVTHLRGDTDADALPDWWESDHFGGRTNAQPRAHGDGDCADNGDEYTANTDPLSADSVFEVVDVHRSTSGGDVVTWSTAPGRKYQVMTHADLPRVNWTTVAVINAYSQPYQAATNITAGSRRFYEITVEEYRP